MSALLILRFKFPINPNIYVKAVRLNIAFKIWADNLLFTNTSHMSPCSHCHKDIQHMSHVALWFMIRNDPCSSSLQPLPHSLPLNMLHPSTFLGCKFPPLSVMKSTNGMKLEGELEKCFPRHQLRLAVTLPRAFTHCEVMLWQECSLARNAGRQVFGQAGDKSRMNFSDGRES